MVSQTLVRKLKRTPGAASSRKVLSLLAYFEPSRPSASMETLAAAIGAPRSTAYRYVSLLREFGFLVEAQAGQYALGPRALGMARAAQAAISYADLARPVMEALSHDTGETVFLLGRVGDHAICLGRADPPTPVRFFLEIGSAVPLHEGASPKLLLAHLPARELERHLTRHRVRKLASELARIRERGLAITVDEITPGVWACAAPIMEDDRVVAAISVAGPAFRIGRARQIAFEARVRAAASQVSAGISERQCLTPAPLTA